MIQILEFFFTGYIICATCAIFNLFFDCIKNKILKFIDNPYEKDPGEIYNEGLNIKEACNVEWYEEDIY